MSDEDLSDLFATGTAPERDPAFILQVAAEMGRLRLRRQMFALALRTTAMLLLAALVFTTDRLLEPLLAQVVGSLPQFMGVPVPVALGVVVVALLLGAQHSALLRRSAIQ